MRCCIGIRPHVPLRQESRGSSQVLTGISGFLSSCDRDLRELLYLPQGSQASFSVAWGSSGFLLSQSRGFRHPLKMWLETQCSLRVVAGSSCLLSSFNGDLGEPLELHKGSHASFPIAWWDSGLLMCSSSGNVPHLGLRWDFMVYLELWRKAQGSSRVAVVMCESLSS